MRISFFSRNKEANRVSKIKLVAIAKDEAAYLVEWVYHHAYFGVDSFDIYVNNTSDNTVRLLNKLQSEFDINIIQADALYQSSGVRFQYDAYQNSVDKIESQQFSHIGFLDIDEFWTPNDFSSSIKSVLNKNIDFDVSVFNWVIHQDESEFSCCFKEQLEVEHNKHVKCFVKTNTAFSIGIHNVLGRALTYADCEGHKAVFEDKIRARSAGAMKQPSAFILHRLYRSELEYISLLGRGRPNGNRFKNNRRGYYVRTDNTDALSFDGTILNSYYHGLTQLIERLDLTVLIGDARAYVEQRYKNVLELAASNTNLDEKKVLHQAFKNIQLPEVTELRTTLGKAVLSGKTEVSGKQAHSGKLERGTHIDAIRDAAIFFDKVDDIESAYALMKLAHELRPEGKFIEQKLKEFKQKRSVNA